MIGARTTYHHRMMLLLLLLPLLLLAGGASGHGRLIEPPSRSSMWRYGFETPPDYNDHELYCGGFSRQWQRNKGRCGICGDPWDTPQPRLHEAGGTYGTGTLVRKYLTGTAITIRIELTANHRGYFEFRMCPVNDFKNDATQECLDRHVLRRADRDSGAEGEAEAHATRLYPGPGNKVFSGRFRLPAGLTCTHCVLQWRYIAGNNWGLCANGTGAVGCGPQEEFRACADVAVVDSAGEADGTPLAPELPGDEEGQEVPARPTDRVPGTAVLVLLIVLCALAGSATVISLMYLYFYHAGDRVKSWLGAHRRRDCKGPPLDDVPPPFKSSPLRQSLCAAPPRPTVGPPPPPAPPPRHKRAGGASIVC